MACFDVLMILCNLPRGVGMPSTEHSSPPSLLWIPDPRYKPDSCWLLSDPLQTRVILLGPDQDDIMIFLWCYPTHVSHVTQRRHAARDALSVSMTTVTCLCLTLTSEQQHLCSHNPVVKIVNRSSVQNAGAMSGLRRETAYWPQIVTTTFLGPRFQDTEQQCLHWSKIKFKMINYIQHFVPMVNFCPP